MKQFDDVFTKEYKSPSYPTQRILQLEDLFKIESERAREAVLPSLLNHGRAPRRFFTADGFFKGKGHKTYQWLLERQIDLKRQKPASGMAPIREWEEGNPRDRDSVLQTSKNTRRKSSTKYRRSSMWMRPSSYRKSGRVSWPQAAEVS